MGRKKLRRVRLMPMGFSEPRSKGRKFPKRKGRGRKRKKFSITAAAKGFGGVLRQARYYYVKYKPKGRKKSIY